MTKIKRLILFCLVCLFIRIGSEPIVASSLCNFNNDMHTRLRQLDSLVDDYVQLDTTLNACLVGGTALTSGLAELNKLLDAEQRPREVDQLAYLARIVDDINAFADRYDQLASGNASFDSKLDSVRFNYAYNLIYVIFALIESYNDLNVGQVSVSNSFQDLSQSLIMNVSGSFLLDILTGELGGSIPIGTNKKTVAAYRALTPSVAAFASDFARVLVKYQPEFYRRVVGWSYRDNVLMFAFSAAVANSSSSANIPKPPPDNALDTLILAPGLIRKFLEDYESFANLSRTPTEADLAFVAVPMAFKDALLSLSYISSKWKYLDIQSDLIDMANTGGGLQSVGVKVADEYRAYLSSTSANKPPIGTNLNEIRDIKSYLLGLERVVNELVAKMKLYQPAGYECLKSTDNLEDITFGLEILRKMFKFRLKPIYNALDTVKEQLNVLKWVIDDYEKIHSGSRTPSNATFQLLLIFKDNIIQYWNTAITYNNFTFQEPKYNDVFQLTDIPVLIGLEQVATEYENIANGGKPDLEENESIKALRAGVPRIKRFVNELVWILKNMQTERDVPLVTRQARKLLATYDSVKKRLNLPNQTLVRSVFTEMLRMIRGVLKNCKKVETGSRRPSKNDVKTSKFLIETLKTFADELVAVKQAYGQRVDSTHVADVVDAITRQLFRIQYVYEFLASNKTSVMTRTITKEKTEKKTKYKTKTKTENWLTRTITDHRDRVRTRFVDRPVTIVETVREHHHQRDRTHTVKVTRTETETRRDEVVRTQTVEKHRTTTRFVTRTVREHAKNEYTEKQKNIKNKENDDDDEEEDEFERRIEKVIKKKISKPY